MDYETIPESARGEAGTEFVAAFERDLAHESCEIYKAMSNRTTNIARFQYYARGTRFFIKRRYPAEKPASDAKAYRPLATC
jgi:hypothetical protein